MDAPLSFWVSLSNNISLLTIAVSIYLIGNVTMKYIEGLAKKKKWDFGR